VTKPTPQDKFMPWSFLTPSCRFGVGSNHCVTLFQPLLLKTCSYHTFFFSKFVTPQHGFFQCVSVGGLPPPKPPPLPPYDFPPPFISFLIPFFCLSAFWVFLIFSLQTHPPLPTPLACVVTFFMFGFSPIAPPPNLCGLMSSFLFLKTLASLFFSLMFNFPPAELIVVVCCHFTPIPPPPRRVTLLS